MALGIFGDRGKCYCRGYLIAYNWTKSKCERVCRKANTGTYLVEKPKTLDNTLSKIWK